MKTMIAVPCMDMMHTAFVQSLMKLDVRPLGSVSVRFHPSSLIYDSRNLLSLEAMQGDFDWILWIDSDMTFPEDAAALLMDAAGAEGADMASGIYFKRYLPTEPVLYKSIEPPTYENGVFTQQIATYTDYPWKSPFPIGGCGFGFVLTSVPLVRRLWKEYGPPFAPFTWAGEDISFCYRAGQSGAKIIADPRFSLKHIGQYEFGEKDYVRKKYE